MTKSNVHYRTEDRGKSWKSFEMPMRPAMVGRPLSFHSDPTKYGYILYQGTACEKTSPWGSVCHDEVRIQTPLVPYVSLSDYTAIRLTTLKTHSPVNPRNSLQKPLAVSSPIAAKTLSTMHTQTSFTVLPSTPLQAMERTHSRPAACSRLLISLTTIIAWKTWESAKTLGAWLLSPSYPSLRL